MNNNKNNVPQHIQYIVMTEKTRENDTFVYYLQHTYNEDMLTTFYHIIKYSDYNGMDSSFDIDIYHLLSKKTVDEMMSVHIGVNHNMFKRSNGVFKIPFNIESIKQYDGRMMALTLNNYFSYGRIDSYFYSLDK
jgi:hypothetical protein